MRSKKIYGLLLAIALCVALVAVAAPGTAIAAPKPAGFVYVMSNATANSVLIFNRDQQGALTPAGSALTGGTGTNTGLGSQGAIAMGPTGDWLVAVNAGSNDISVFKVKEDGSLVLTDRESSWGTDPVSVTIDNRIVYVLNQGGSGNIAGFRLDGQGHLSFLNGSVEPLSNWGSGTAPTSQQIGMSRTHNVVIVTELSTNKIDVYPLTNSVAGWPSTFLSNGTNPYGFGVTGQGDVIVSEAGANALSSYSVWPGSLNLITGSLVDGGTAPCWVAIGPDARYAYTSDAHSSDLSIYAIWNNGALTLAQGKAVTVDTPLNLDVAQGGKYLYVVSAGTTHAVAGFQIWGQGGSLTSLGTFGALPASASGLVAR